MAIPLVDLKAPYNSIKDEIDDAIQGVIQNSQFILGEEVAAFESELATYCHTKYAIGVASGTDALHLALLACEIKPGDEVITTPFTFISTTEMICECGAKLDFTGNVETECPRCGERYIKQGNLVSKIEIVAKKKAAE